MNFDLTILSILEKEVETANRILYNLAKKYEVKLTTPYFEENVGDVIDAIEKRSNVKSHGA